MLHAFEEIEILRQSCRGDSEKQREKTLKTFGLLSGFGPRIRPLGESKLCLDHGIKKIIWNGHGHRQSH
jgi:hypothetical protein